ncbi:MAG: hypothetical protein ACR2HG_06990 [Pyrinomonadaceae bacterium]
MPATGHAKNVANFETVNIILTNLGAEYNPSQPLILPPALQTKLTAAKAALAAVDGAEAAKKIAVNERAAEFDALQKLAVNVKRTAEVEVNDDAFTENLAAVIHKLRGTRAGDAPVDDPATLDIDESKNTRSVSARGYDNQVAYFADLIALLKTQSTYNPNEAEMKIPALETKLDTLETKNNAAKTAAAALGSAMDTRDEVLYDDHTGVIKLVKLIKAQIARKPGTNSQP